MADVGFLLGIPTESVAIRLVVAALVAVPLSRVLLRLGIRQPRIRVFVALVPTVVLASVLAWSLSDPRVPILGHSAAEGIPVRFGNVYVPFADYAIQILLAVWAAVGVSRITWRFVRRRRAHREVAARIADAPLVPLHVALTADRVAADLGIPMPPVSVVEACEGGACVHGVRRPQLLLDQRLVDRLDRQELEAVLAHELAHVKRRDNLTALLVGVMRDIFFFVPGSAWASRQLHAERELAADQVACATTQRPGALASGLLKVLDLQASRHAAAAALMPEMPETTLLGRVKLLVSPQELSPLRRRAEVAVILSATVVAGAVGLGAPAMVNDAGVDSFMFFYTPGGAPTAPEVPTLSSQATVFDLYRSTPLAAPAVEASSIVLDDDPGQFRSAMLQACIAGDRSVCTSAQAPMSLGLRSRVTEPLPEPPVALFRADPVISTDVFHFYVYRIIDDQRTR